MRYRHKGLEIRICDQLAEAGFMPSGALQNQGTLVLAYKPPDDDGDEEVLFVNGAGYRFRIWREKRFVFMQRNEHLLKVIVKPFSADLHIFAEWSPARFLLASHSERDFQRAPDAVAETQTDDVIVPLKLYKWAHEASLLPVDSFSSLAEFSSLLAENLKQAEQRITEAGAHTAFWNYRRRAKPVPKSEPQAMRAFAGLLRDRATLHGYEILQETQAGTGSLDLLAVGKQTDGEILKIAIEGKHAHSQDLFHGLRDQLPTYMRNTRADRGIYLVFWFRCERFDFPDKERLSLIIELNENAFKEITAHLVDVSIPIAPSNRKHQYH